MSFTRVLTASLVAVFGLITPLTAAETNPAKPLNVVLILVDDMGITDLGCYGSKFFETPNVDQLAREGVKFTESYASCTVCSPTRAALLTGKSPARLHITDWIPGEDHPKAKLKIPDWTKYLPLEEITLAEQLKASGYATISIGKWHLTPGLKEGDEAYYPDKQGFDVNIGGYHRGQPASYFSPYHNPVLTDGPKGEFLTDREAAEAVKFIEANKDKPFFVYLPHYAVHDPLGGKPEYIEKFKAKAATMPESKQHNATYAALVKSVDDALGTIRTALKRLNLDDHTIIIFTSDNGGKMAYTDNSPYRAGKGSAYEGGVRVPLIVYWPNVTKAGTTEATPVISHDLYPTVLSMTAVKPLQSLVDGADLTPLIKNTGKLDRDALYWHYPHYHGGGSTPHSAIRSGDYRLVHFYEDNHDELYKLTDNASESPNIADQEPARTKSLRERLESWLKSVDAQLPTPNPNYDPKAETKKKKGKAENSEK